MKLKIYKQVFVVFEHQLTMNTALYIAREKL